MCNEKFHYNEKQIKLQTDKHNHEACWCFLRVRFGCWHINGCMCVLAPNKIIWIRRSHYKVIHIVVINTINLINFIRKLIYIVWLDSFYDLYVLKIYYPSYSKLLLSKSKLRPLFGADYRWAGSLFILSHF